MPQSEFCIVNENKQFMEKYANGIPLVELIPFYEALASNEPLVLDWVCPGRKNPKVEHEKSFARSEDINLQKTKTSESLLVTAKMKEFDFDEPFNQKLNDSNMDMFSSIQSLPAAQNTSLPLRRINNNYRPPPRQPRVASMDKILNDFFKTRKEPNIPLTSITTLPSNTVTYEASNVSTAIDTLLVNPFNERMFGDDTDQDLLGNFSVKQSAAHNSVSDQQESLANELARTSVSSQNSHPQIGSMDIMMEKPNENAELQSTPFMLEEME